MSDKTTIYMGGERDKQKSLIPTGFEDFFKRNFLLLILALLVVLLIFVKVKF